MKRISHRMLPQLLLTAAICAAGLGQGSVRGDDFTLTSGGVVRGEWLNPGAGATAPYQVELPFGGRVELARDSVVEVKREREAETEYRRIAPLYGDTIEEQWELAEWCRLRTLPRQRVAHLERILDHDPDHAAARRALGYSQVGGEWLTRKGWAEKEGYQYYDGRWRLPDEIELLKARSEQLSAQNAWKGRLKRIREDLAGDRAPAARDELLAVRDPAALAALAEYLERDPHRGAKLLYLRAAANIGTFNAARVLVHVTLNDPDEEVFHEAVDLLLQLDTPGIQKPYIDALADQNNVRVNRAAHVLGQLGKPEAIPALIDALVTTHVIVIQPRQGDAITTTFGPPPPPGAGGNSLCRNRGPVTGLSAGSKATVLSTNVPNQEVLSSLVKLSGGASFGFDKQAWTNWHEQERQRGQSLVDARRD